MPDVDINIVKLTQVPSRFLLDTGLTKAFSTVGIAPHDVVLRYHPMAAADYVVGGKPTSPANPYQYPRQTSDDPVPAVELNVKWYPRGEKLRETAARALTEAVHGVPELAKSLVVVYFNEITRDNCYEDGVRADRAPTPALTA